MEIIQKKYGKLKQLIFAAEKIQGFNFLNLIKRILKIGGQVTEPYYQNWIYHKYGSGNLFKMLSKKIQENNGIILLNSNIISINIDNKNILSVTYEKNGEIDTLKCDYLINTIPLSEFIKKFNISIPFSVEYSSSKLSYISLIIAYLEFEVDKISDYHWIYLLDNIFNFNRVTEQKHLSPSTIGKGKTILSFELTCKNDDYLWQLDDKEIFKLLQDEIKHIPFIAKHRIADYIIKRFQNAYEIYNKDFDKCADIIFTYLKSYNNLITTGRRGLFLQGDMHQAMELGINAAKLLLEENLSRSSLNAYYNNYLKYLD